ncbi:MAG: LptA/OstA family protein [Cyanobacteria bacterium P01_G01_bin.49]
MLSFSRSVIKNTLGTVGCTLAVIISMTTLKGVPNTAQAQTQPPPPNSPLTVRSDIQEANSETGVVTARGNVQIFYPARDIQGTSAQAQYFSRERRLVLTGNVYVLQEGNSMRAETMTYLIDEGRFIATPETTQQVESIYLVTEAEDTPAAPAPVSPAPPLDNTLPTPDF